MKIRKFEAETVRAAMDQALRELGEDAVILNTREVRDPGTSGAPLRVELMAAVDEAAAAGHVLAAPRDEKAGTVLAGQVEPAMAEELAMLRGALESLVGEGVLAAHTIARMPAERRLREAGVDASVALQIARSLRECESLDEAVRHWACLFNCARPQFPEAGTAAWAVVGPSGAGKTTMLAKLAAHYQYRSGRKVAVIGCDTSRIGASEQLEKTTALLQVPSRSCMRPEDLPRLLDEMQEFDLVLIDTPGGSHLDGQHMAALQEWMADERISVHLTVPAHLSADARREVMRAYQPLEPHRVMITKLDEISSRAVLFGISQMAEASLSFYSDSQSIPAGVKLAEPLELARMALADLM